MKKILMLLCAGALIVSALCVGCDKGNVPEAPEEKPTKAPEDPDKSPYFYYYFEEKIWLTLDAGHAYLSLREPEMPEDIAGRGVTWEEFMPDRGQSVELGERYWTILNFEEGLLEEDYLTLLKEIKSANPEVIIEPSFRSEYGNMSLLLSRTFGVELKKAEDISILEREAKKVGAVIDHRDKYMPLWYTLSITENSKYNAMELANSFHESGLFECAVPDFYGAIVPLK